MGDILLQVLLPALLAIAIPTSYIASRQKINPITIITTFFFLPAIIATLRLSGLQSKEWEWETYAAIWLTVGCWLLLPLIILLIKRTPDSDVNALAITRTQSFRNISHLFIFWVIFTYLASNYIQARTLLPILIPDLAYELHTEFPPILRLFARCIPISSGISYLLFYTSRKKLDLALFIITLMVPLTRLSRIDVALGMLLTGILFTNYPLFKITTKRIIATALVGVALTIGSVELGNQRTNRFGTYQIKYDSAIKWRSDYYGPAGIFPVMYGYFPLSFENLDAFFKQSKDKSSFTGASLSWFLVGVVKANWFGAGGGGPGGFVPVSSAANVPTALHPLVSDFGLFGIIFPGSIYTVFWVWLFYNAKKKASYLLSYSIYTAAFALSSFQALIVAPIIFHQIVAVFIIFLLAKISLRNKEKQSVKTTNIGPNNLMNQ